MSSSTSTRIESYFVQYQSRNLRKRIRLEGSGGRIIGYLNFIRDGADLPADGLSSDDPQLYYYVSDFANCLDLLRNEKPCYLHWAGAGGANSLNTSIEEAGEGEA